MDVLRAEIVFEVRRHGLRLGDLFGLKTVTLEHVLEVHVAADIELVGAVEHHAAVFEQLGHDTVCDGCADLALDVVTDDRDAGVFELLGPHGVRSDEHGERVDEGNLGVDGALGVVLVGLFRTHREVGNEDVGLGVLEDLDDVDAVAIGFFDGFAVVLAETVERVSALDDDARRRNVGDLDGVVLARLRCFGEVEADLLGIDVESGDEFDVLDVVFAELNVHESGDRTVRICVPVELDTLYQ